jgi:hypothetical protein
MAIVVPSQGLEDILEYALNKTEPTEVKLKLFKNDLTPDADTVIGDFTESDIAGYDAGGKTLAGASWTVATATGTEGTFAEQTWTFTEAGSIYGYYVTNNAGTAVLWCERFTDAPHTFPSGGGTESITPAITIATAS